MENGVSKVMSSLCTQQRGSWKVCEFLGEGGKPSRTRGAREPWEPCRQGRKVGGRWQSRAEAEEVMHRNTSAVGSGGKGVSQGDAGWLWLGKQALLGRRGPTAAFPFLLWCVHLQWFGGCIHFCRATSSNAL